MFQKSPHRRRTWTQKRYCKLRSSRYDSIDGLSIENSCFTIAKVHAKQTGGMWSRKEIRRKDYLNLI